MDILSIFFNMKVYCVFSLESPHRSDSNEYTQYTIFNIKRNLPEIIQILQLCDFSQGFKNKLHFNRCVMLPQSMSFFFCKSLYLGVRAQQTLS